MTWRKLSDCQWAAVFGGGLFRIVRRMEGYEAHLFGMAYHIRGQVSIRWIGNFQSLAKAKRRCEAERIMG